MAPEFLADKSLLSSEGAEHKVFLWSHRNHVVKHTWPGAFGFVPLIEGKEFSIELATPDDYLRRVEIHNQVFGDHIQVEGVLLLPYEKGVLDPVGDRGWSIVISQPFQEGEPATEKDIARFLAENGFRKAPPRNVWYRPEDGVLLSDAHQGNFVAIDGIPIPIDLHLNQVPPAAFTEAGWMGD